MLTEETALTKESFALLIREAGFKNKKDFAKFIDTPYSSVNNWGGCNRFPRYVRALLISLIKSHKYDNLIKSDSIALENDALKKKIKELEENISELESRLNDFKSLQKALSNLKNLEA